VQTGIIKDDAPVTTKDIDGERLLSRHDVYLKLRDKAASLPYVGSLTIINARGRLINFFAAMADPEHRSHGSRLLQSERMDFARSLSRGNVMSAAAENNCKYFFSSIPARRPATTCPFDFARDRFGPGSTQIRNYRSRLDRQYLARNINTWQA
jgi:hypothetical protein